MSNPARFKAELSSALTRWKASPGLMVRELFKRIPDAWQDDVFDAFPETPRIAMQACTGPGKTFVLACLGWNFLLTRPDSMVGATSCSGQNLRSGLWTELARLYEATPLLKEAFEFTNNVIRHRGSPTTWKMEARTWAADANAEQIGAALKGLHAKHIMWLLDETGGYPNSILPTVEAIFSGEPKEAHIVQAGNPMKRSGPLFWAAVLARHLWTVFEVTADPDDPKRTPRVSIEHAREQIAQHGRDNPWVRMNILGLFPLADVNALIGEDEVRASMKRMYREHDLGDASRILGVDVARQGDDASSICRRRGLQVWPFKTLRGLESVKGAAWVNREWSEFEADAAFIDMTGGFGAGWYDQLLVLGRSPIGVQYAGAPHDKGRYANKRVEMYFDAVEWIKRGGALPESPKLLAALTQTLYTPQGDRILLEPKEEVKKKIGYSPDEADSFVQTFAEPISRARKSPEDWTKRREAPVAKSDYQPFHDMDQPMLGF